MSSFLNKVEGYESGASAGKSGYGFYEVVDGDNDFIVLSGAIDGWQVWPADGGKPVRAAKVTDIDESIYKGEQDRFGNDLKPQYFMAFPVLDIKDGGIKLFQTKGKRQADAITGLANNAKWSDQFIKGCVITLNKQGSGTEVSYSAVPAPIGSEMTPEATAFGEATWKLANMFEGQTPWASDF